MALTAFDDEATKQKCLEIGIREIFNKPITLEKILKIILMYHFKLDQ